MQLKTGVACGLFSATGAHSENIPWGHMAWSELLHGIPRTKVRPSPEGVESRGCKKGAAELGVRRTPGLHKDPVCTGAERRSGIGSYTVLRHRPSFGRLDGARAASGRGQSSVRTEPISYGRNKTGASF